ncbi:16S rRNA (cytidine(1402)-2'-O)-methyltransferase [Candidatus Phytoplasma phoenicium]|uniref:Ribosomal RNA small subunit methyltransferase I n=1 Tax=Candidatus Phytoplasma phoenicium TaxID=198422 RepID=A0A0L0MK46_9MOLU|nr:16S rRNA (cytidine(1402)-2'-O)-methyltransferase [Candidatus Phytoplasma phoenicium]KND62758.1 Tetrapyrrole (Corrin/Porphyrin) Methylase [Candidatus Phytoplasma phoenicium]
MISIQQTFLTTKATLYLVATPIGNLSDLSFRAVEILRQVNYILTEDTRRAQILLNHYHLRNHLISLHQYNEKQKITQLLALLQQGKNLALISDAGTPLISDPGLFLVQEIQKAGFYVTTVPGASAFLAAFSLSSFALPFIFCGFLPKKIKQKNQTLEKYRFWSETLIFYESPQRITHTLILVQKYYPQRKIALMRELTKKFETIMHGTIEEFLTQKLSCKGEYVLVIEGCTGNEYHNVDLDEAMFFLKNKGFTEKEIFNKLAKNYHLSKKDIYRKYKIQISEKEKDM